MKKIFFFALVAMAISACGESYVDEQMDAVMLKGGKTEKVKVKPTKNEKEGVMPLSTRSVAMYVDDDIVRHPTSGDGSSTSDKPANGGGSSTKKNSGGLVTKPLK